MERVHYRRHTPRGEEAREKPKEKSGSLVVEKLIMQGIVSGILFAAVLLLTLFPQGEALRANLVYAIGDHSAAEQIVVEVRRLLDLDEAVFVYEEERPSPAYGRQGVRSTPIENFEFTRIDENILRALAGFENSEDLKSLAPEPPIIPEL